jgi:hypothetical protein
MTRAFCCLFAVCTLLIRTCALGSEGLRASNCLDCKHDGHVWCWKNDKCSDHTPSDCSDKCVANNGHSDCKCTSCDDKSCQVPTPAPTPPPPAPTPPTPAPPPPTPPSPFAHQQWYLPSSVTKDTWLFKANIYKCVDLLGGDTTNGNLIVIWDCNNGPSQQWHYDPFKSGYIRYAGNPSKCVDLVGGDTTNGIKLQIWDVSCMHLSRKSFH